MGRTLQILRPYLVTLRVAYDDYFQLLYRAELLPQHARLTGDIFVSKKIFRAKNRKTVVRKAVQWFWKQFKGGIGTAYDVLTINDPYGEVIYGPQFSCADLLNKYLDRETIRRVIKKSKGKIVRDERTGFAHHPPNSVRRVKRRRKYHKRVASRISISSTGVLYYRVTLIPQISREGVILQKRKIHNMRLTAQSLTDAHAEISERGLDALNDANTLRKFKRASLFT